MRKHRNKRSLISFFIVDAPLFTLLFQTDSYFRMLGFDFTSIDDLGLKIYTTSINLCLIIFSTIYFVRNISAVVKTKSFKYLIGILLFILVSILWVDESMQPQALIDYINLLGITIEITSICIFCYKNNIDLWTRIKNYLFWIFMLLWAYYFIFPTRGIDEIIDNRYKSVYSSPNNLGQICGISLVFLIAYITKKDIKNFSIGLLFIIVSAIFFLIASQSVTSGVSVFLVLIICIIRVFYKSAPKIAFVLGIIVCLLPALYTNAFGTKNTSKAPSIYISGNVERDATLTGRTQIWSLCMSQVKKEDKYILGFGFGGFWSPENSPSDVVTEILSSRIQEAHNGIIDIYLQFGIIGMFIILLFLMRTISNKRYLTQRKDIRIIENILLFIILNNITESSFFQPKHILFSFLILCFMFPVLAAKRKEIISN